MSDRFSDFIYALPVREGWRYFTPVIGTQPHVFVAVAKLNPNVRFLLFIQTTEGLGQK